MPMNASRRFGAARPQPRPSECELGHCGVDLGSAIGEPVFSVFDGVVEKVERDPWRGGRAGIYVKLAHRGGAVVSRYLHLDSVASGLEPGTEVRGGQVIGRLGRTGIHSSAPHLHFGLNLRQDGVERYIDPEPYLREWQLPELETTLARLDERPR